MDTKNQINRHSRKFLSGIPTALKIQGGDPRLQASGMTSHGFTLIELLVVVLIIGILAAIALPQYQKAVEKSRLAEALQNISTIQQAVDLHVLVNGYPSNGRFFLLSGGMAENNYKIGRLDIDLEKSLTCRDYQVCSSSSFSYSAYCQPTGCEIDVIRSQDGDPENERNDYGLWLNKSSTTGEWTKTCEVMQGPEYAEKICESLQEQGWEQL